MPFRVPHEAEPGTSRTPTIDVVKLFSIFCMAGSQLVEPEKQYDVNLLTVIKRDERVEGLAGT